MKKFLIAIFLVFFITAVFAQSPQKLNYQAIARDNTGSVIANQPVTFRLSIRDLTPGGNILFMETHSTSTNDFGLSNLVIGNGALIMGNFSTINWGTGAKYLEVELDPTGGTTYQSIGTTQLMSVPYALYAEEVAGGAVGPTGPIGPAGPAGPIGPTGPAGGGSSVNCGTTFNSDYTIRGYGSGVWECTDALKISSTGYVSINTSPSSSYRLKVNGNVGIGTSPSSSYELSVDGDAHVTDYMAIGTTPSTSYKLRVYGNTGIGTSTSSSYELDVDGDTRVQDGLGVGTTPPSSGLYIGSSSNFYVPTSLSTGTYTSLYISSGRVYKASSSIRFKENVQDLNFNKENFFKIRPVTFNYKKEFGDNSITEVGFIAEEVEKLVPDLVVYEYQDKVDADGNPILDENGNPERENTGQLEGIKYDRICVYLYQIVRDQENRITELEAEIKNLKANR